MAKLTQKKLPSSTLLVLAVVFSLLGYFFYRKSLSCGYEDFCAPGHLFYVFIFCGLGLVFCLLYILDKKRKNK